ncbi:radial spoke head 14 homolog [Acanthopagrus latus]|uniref:radial spoke head 14 homolog n=1 Tax=Acanthopagrus latus TaxID=8177 RepID=UPI00187C4302|nr:radial spoke head 14 homolog [Acanthopagrus latus]
MLMAGGVTDPSRAPVAFGRRAVPQLFEELQQPDQDRRLRALNSLCDLMHDPERIQQTIRAGFLEQLKVLLEDEDPSVRTKTCELLLMLSCKYTASEALLSSSLLPPLSQLLDDSSSSCRRSVHRVMKQLSVWTSGASALLPLVPKLMLKLNEEEDEEALVLLLSTVSCCSRVDVLPALASDGVSLLGQKLSHPSPNIRREAAAAMMTLSVCEDGRQQVCEQALLPVLVGLLREDDIEVQIHAAGVIMYVVVITPGKLQCLDLDAIPVFLDLVSKKKEEEDRRRVLVMYSLRVLTALAEAPDGRRLLLEQLPLLVARSEATEEDENIRRAAQTAVRVITWTP